MEKLRLSDFISDDGWFHVSRVGPRAGDGLLLHGHEDDFAEVFWVERGRGLHFVNGVKREVERGDIVLMRPGDEHALRLPPRAEDALIIVNVAFNAGTLDFLRARYFEGVPFPWQGDEEPAQFVLERETLDFLSGWADATGTHQTRLELESFLMVLLHALAKPPRTIGWSASGQLSLEGPQQPEWLEHALVRFNDPRHLGGGVPELARLCGRSPEHLNRVLHRTTGRTTTVVVNELRLQWVATQLRMTNRSIGEIAADCGFGGASHFHRLFRERFGISPRRFRLRSQGVV